MLKRTLWGVAAAIIAIVVIFSNIFWLKMTVVLLLSFLGSRELMAFRPVPSGRCALYSYSVLIAFLIVGFSLWGPQQATFLILSAFIILSIASVVSANSTSLFERETHLLGFNTMGLLYLCSMFSFLVPLTELGNHGPQYCLLLFLIVFAGDSAAYFIGKQFGSSKLAPSLSPKKTLIGSFAALLMSVCVTGVWGYVAFGSFTDPHFFYFLAMAPFFSLLAQMGDLLESLLKRATAVKDSGNFLPGHGGVLDRLDGLVLCSPVFYYFVYWIEN